MKRKALIMAAGKGTRLLPITAAVNKHLVPVYDKPMILYSLSTVMLAGSREILIITNSGESDAFRRLLGDGERFGVNITYVTQQKPAGLPDAYILAEEFLDGEASIMTLGDNLFYGHGLSNNIRQGLSADGASIFLYYVENPRPYGVAVMNGNGNIVDVVEKPQESVSNFAISGLYLFDGQASEIAQNLSPSDRGELEIVDMIRFYMTAGRLNAVHTGRGMTWMDMGTADRLLAASNYVQLLQSHANLRVCVPEEIAWRNGWIDGQSLERSAVRFEGTTYGQYLRMLPELPKY
jgi:glucose-1-phosphate thymidylyltransferase